LLDENRPDEVILLLKDETRSDGLLLRLALAEKAIGVPTLNNKIAVLAARFGASRQRQDARHKREEARFTLTLLNQPREALKLAQTNWAVQREPWDARVLLESALSAHDLIATKQVTDWLQKSKLEDIHLVALASQRRKS